MKSQTWFNHLCFICGADKYVEQNHAGGQKHIRGSSSRFVSGTTNNFIVCSKVWELTFATHPTS